MTYRRIPNLPARLAVLDTRRVPPPPKEVDPHYRTVEHQRWRELVIARARGMCEWPGCGRAEARMFADHKVELQDDRTRALDLSNGQCLCGQHHTIKTNQHKANRLGNGVRR